MTVGERIKKVRQNAGLTQKQLADKLGVSYVNVSQWESGRRNPKYETLSRISRALSVSPSELLGIKLSQNEIKQSETGEFDAFLDYLQSICSAEGIELELWQTSSKGTQPGEDWDPQKSFFWSVIDHSGSRAYSFRTEAMQDLFQKVNDYTLYLIKKKLE